MKTTLFDHRAHDGSREFINLPECYPWDVLQLHVLLLEGGAVTGYISDEVTEMWLDFTYRGHSFSINNQLGEFWFFVDDPACPDEILIEVGEHFEGLLDP